MRVRKQLFTLFISVALLVVLLPLSVWGVDYLTNPGLEAPFTVYGDYNGWDLQVANGWEKFIVKENTYNNGSRLRFFSASDWAAFNGSSVTEKVEGSEAQVWWSSSTKKFDAGIYQQVRNLTIGETYGFQAAVLQVFEKTNRSDPATGMMTRQWGIDPAGGTSPTATTVIWSPPEQHATYTDGGGKKYTWFWGSAGAEALSTTMTVFVRVSSVGGGSTPNSDQVWVDDAFFDIAPTTALTVSLNTPTQAQAQWNGAPRTGFTLYAFEAQYRPLTATQWTALQLFDVQSPSPPTGTEAVFSVQPGQMYLVRARTWHQRSVNGRTHQVAGPWQEVTFNTASNSFSNPGLETFQPNGVAEDWNAFTVSGLVTHTDALSYAAQSGTSPRVKEGNNAQVWYGDSAFEAGIYQQVYSLTIDNVYGFAAYQAYTPTGALLTQSVGIDPAGGSNPAASTVIWSNLGTGADWKLFGIGAKALSTTMTVFIRGEHSGGGAAAVWADSASLGSAAETNLSLSTATPYRITAAWGSVPSTGYTLYGYQVQYRAAGNSAWTNLHTLADGLSPASKAFTATAGTSYTVRARSWQQAGTQTLPGPWTEKTIIPQAKLQGLTLGNQGLPFQGALVSIADESMSNKSDYYGQFAFTLQPGSHVLTASNSTGWHTRAPVTVAVSDTQATSVTLTLIPPDDIIVNGDFEDALNGWQRTFSGNVIGSGYISAGLVLTQSGVLSQSGSFGNAYTPTLTFWYKIEGGGGALTARVFGRDTLLPTAALTLTQSANNWQLAVLPLNLDEYVSDGSGGSMLLTGTTAYTGPAGVRFTAAVSGSAIIYLDEVVFGSAQPARKMPTIYLPMVMKDYSPPPPPSDCPATSTRSYHTIPVDPPPIDHPDNQHGDLNLSLRSWEPASTALQPVYYSGSHDSNAPQLAGLFANNPHRPSFSAVWQVYDWNWGCGEHGCRGNLLTQWPATLLGLQTTPGEEIAIPTRSPNIYSDAYQNYKAVVIYAEEKRITFVYIRMDRIATLEPSRGYAVHLEDICVDPNLLTLYRASLKDDHYRKDSYQLPGLTNNQVLGTALGSEIKVAIRDGGTFMDPRSKYDWWQAY